MAPNRYMGARWETVFKFSRFCFFFKKSLERGNLLLAVNYQRVHFGVPPIIRRIPRLSTKVAQDHQIDAIVAHRAYVITLGIKVYVSRETKPRLGDPLYTGS